MIRTLKFTALSFAIALPALAAPPEMTAEQKAMAEAYAKAGAPGEAHARLAKMAGEYDLSISSWEAPGGPPTVEKGTATRAMTLDGRVMTEHVTSTMWGQPWQGHGMYGFDNVTGKHWGTWNDSMSTGIMVSEGTCDDQNACTFTGSWNDPISKGKITARMTTRWTDATTEVFEMYTPGPDGKEFKMMEITYRKRAN
jgi:hypothetical protein